MYSSIYSFDVPECQIYRTMGQLGVFNQFHLLPTNYSLKSSHIKFQLITPRVCNIGILNHNDISVTFQHIYNEFSISLQNLCTDREEIKLQAYRRKNLKGYPCSARVGLVGFQGPLLPTILPSPPHLTSIGLLIFPYLKTFFCGECSSKYTKWLALEDHVKVDSSVKYTHTKNIYLKEKIL